MTPELSQELRDVLKDIVKSCEKEDNEIRKSQVREWQKLEEFWHGVQYLFWSEQDNAWRSPLDIGFTDDEEVREELGTFSDKVINIFRGHGESIVAALSAQIPALRYLPDDADDDDDVLAARTRSKVADLVQRHNKAKLVFLRAMYFLALNGVVASYRYKDSDFKYGSYKKPVIGEDKQDVVNYTCKDCGYESEEPIDACPQCGATDIKEKKSVKSVPVITEVKEEPKTRVKIDIFGPLHFKVPFYARNQDECTYFLLFGDIGKDSVKERWPDLEDEIDGERLDSNERFVRSDFGGGLQPEESNLVTVRKCWLRPATFFRCTDKNKRKQLQKLFPKGAKVTFIGKQMIFAEVEEESLDACWQIGQAGLSTYIYADPMMRPLIQIQELRNDLVNLIVDTIKHGIPIEYADPSVLNFDQMGKFEALPGNVYPTKSGRPGEPIGNAFHTSQRATLPKEIGAVIKQFDQDAQFAVGAFPSIYGGPSEGKSRTFAEYAASRQMALQRLSIVWNLLTDWWVRTISGAVDLYVDSMTEDEHFTKYEDNNYIKVWIKKSQLSGKIGGVEPEASETFPVSLAQKKDLLIKLMEMNNEYVNSALYLPENARILQDVLALNEFKMPGEAQRMKQCFEIAELLKNTLIGPEQSSVPIDPDIDDHKVHIATITAWAVDTVGLDAKTENPQGYANVMAHRKEHLKLLIMQTLQQNETAPGVPPKTAEGVA